MGDDWAEDHHDVELMEAGGKTLARARLSEGAAGMARLHARNEFAQNILFCILDLAAK